MQNNTVRKKVFSNDNRDSTCFLAPDPHACYHPRAFAIFRLLNEHQSAAPVKTPSFARPSRENSFCFSPEHHIASHPDSPFVFSFRYVRQLTTNGRIRWNHHHRAPSASDQAPSFLARWEWTVATLYTLDIFLVVCA